MFIRFGEKTYEIDAPLPVEGHLVVAVDAVAFFPEVKSDVGQMFRFAHSKQKLVYHTLREGPQMTLNKIKSSWFQRDIINAKRLVLVIGSIAAESETQKQRVVAVGPADCPESEFMIFPGACVAQIDGGRDIESVYAQMHAYFQKHEEHARALFYYDPYSGSPIPFRLADVLQEVTKAEKVPVEVLEPPRSGATALAKPKADAEKNVPFNLFLAGAGVYSCISILPYLKENVRRHMLVDKHPGLACAVAEKYGFEYRDVSGERGLARVADVEKPIVVIATYHSTHVALAEIAFRANPRARIFIEKPPVTDKEQIKSLLRMREEGAHIEIGYNRRCIKDVRRAKAFLEKKSGPTTVTCIVREKNIPMTHWYYWPAQGTRIVGNVTHWIDLGMHFIDAMPVRVNTMSSSARFPVDEAAVSVHFDDGSQLNIIATDRGNGLRGIQEYIDVRREDMTILMDDFLRFTVMEGGSSSVRRNALRDKGHKRMYKEFLARCHADLPAVYPTKDLDFISRLYLDVKDALMEGKASIDLDYSKPL